MVSNFVRPEFLPQRREPQRGVREGQEAPRSLVATKSVYLSTGKLHEFSIFLLAVVRKPQQQAKNVVEGYNASITIALNMSDPTPVSVENPFSLEVTKPKFESMGGSNGFRYWYASELAALLSYESYSGFLPAVNKAMTACNALGISIMENFQEETRVIEGKTFRDFKLSRFACYLCAMNGDVRKPISCPCSIIFRKTCRGMPSLSRTGGRY